MHRAPQSVVHRDQLENFRATAGLLADTQSELQGLHTLASKVPKARLEASVYRKPLVPGRLDYTLQSFMTRSKRSTKDPETRIGFERTLSEVYPEAPPRDVRVLMGQNSRFVGRDPVVLLP
jgi:hypothetical protein